MKTHAVIVIALASALALAGPARAQTADVLGKWDVSINTGQETIPATLTLKKDGDKIIGGIRDGRAPDKGEAPLVATVAENKITISFDYADASNGAMHIVMNGNVEKDTMSGSVTFGEMGQGEWTAKRSTAADTKAPEKSTPEKSAPAAPSAGNADVTGTWNVSVAAGEINATPTIVLKQDGEKITGQYISTQYGSFPVQGTIKGNELTLNVNMTIEGNALGVILSGTVDKDTVSGKISYGGFADGTFAGKKKQ